MTDIFIFVLAILGGWLVGVIINALADDLPHRRNPQRPHYPNGYPRPLIAWSALLAYLTGNWEGQPVRLSEAEEKELSLAEIASLEMDTALTWRHLLVELAMPAIYVFVLLYHPDHPRTFIWMVFLAILMLITVIDWEHRLILFVTIIPSAIIVLILNAIGPTETADGEIRTYSDFLFGGLLGYITFWVMYYGGTLFVRLIAYLQGRRLNEVAFGFGDVMLAGLCGLMIGWYGMFYAIFVTVFVGAFGSILYIVWRLVASRRYTMYAALPYGPYIVIGTVAMMLFTDTIRAILGV